MCGWGSRTYGDEEVGEFNMSGMGRLTIGYAHEKVHSAESYRVGGIAPIAAAASMCLLIKTKSSDPHCEFTGGTTGNAKAFLYEGTAVSANGTPKTARALNRQKGTDNGCAASFWVNPTITSKGATLIELYMFGGDRKSPVGAEGRSESEWILAKNTNYLMKVLNTSGAAASAWMAVEFYED